ncbi:MAG: UDP-N-acetylmuramate dehydrogenase [Burkholderiaceae bacterium]|nr:UDP-N-acetylmuramate dehydrogenase [Burkholderiaceae bacterium]
MARQAWTVSDPACLDAVLEAAVAAGRERAPFVLAGGSNLLLARDIDEPLLLVRLTGRKLLEQDGDRVLVEVAAGEPWHPLVRWTLDQGLAGLENLALIPGLVGAAPWQNIGAYGVEVASRIDSVAAIEIATGRRRSFSGAECAFAYRDSFFKSQAGRGWLITAVRLRLSRASEPQLDYGELRAEIARRAGPRASTMPTPVEVADAVEAIRRRKLPDPAVIGNAGSFFKNPVVTREKAEALLGRHPALPTHPVVDDPARVKLSAGWLIEQAGWRGHREGDAGVSAAHALVLVNHGRATGAQLLALARRVQVSVQDSFGVALEPEPVIVD